ncbi:Os01g0150301 [Oryza sativa Japonica Group]|jgi:hypothetical protein|uniref:Os01g0150301 protein n=1 Tax=Oryza sativa subsp. japonica TaxID=39947 RepID=A0A0P0UYS2_ORYSJ|nr:Os01g0150301 [Oryza sativa Japonica Group]
MIHAISHIFARRFCEIRCRGLTQIRVGVASPIPNCPHPRHSLRLGSHQMDSKPQQRHDLLEDDMAMDYRLLKRSVG